MQALNSVGDTRKALSVTGLGMLVAFLFLVPLAAFAASSTVTVNATYTAATNQVAVSGTVTPAPGVSGTNVAVEITSPTGVVVDANQFAVNSATGAYNGTFVTGGPSYSVNGTYTVTANYNGGTASATFQYGTMTTTSAWNRNYNNDCCKLRNDSRSARSNNDSRSARSNNYCS